MDRFEVEPAELRSAAGQIEPLAASDMSPDHQWEPQQIRPQLRRLPDGTPIQIEIGL